MIGAFVLCGGLGTRLRSVLSDRPKSMALISGVPFLQLLLERLRHQGIYDVVLGTGYMAEKIESYFGNGKDFGMRLSYSRESAPLGTAGALKLAETQLSEPILVLNGDSYVEWDAAAMLDVLQTKDAQVVIALQPVGDVARYGSVTCNQDNRITGFVEKGVNTGSGLINAGVYLLRKEIVSDLPAGQSISLEKDIFPTLLDRRVYGFLCNGLFIDIGIPEDLQKAQNLLASQARR
jgi:D-glycero-alpha-D-manno-heptose 1-phosphate guanylyltransferase